jgi:hypothetical protein
MSEEQEKKVEENPVDEEIEQGSKITEEIKDPEKPKKSRKLLMIIGIILVICCLGGAMATYFSGSDEGDGTAQTSEVSEAVANKSVDLNVESEDQVEEPKGDELPAAQDEQAAETVVEEEQEPATSTPVPEPTETIPPTPVPTDTPQPTPTPMPVGYSRALPFAPGETVSSESWEVQVLETVRGEEAWNKIIAANQFNDPPPEGMEYISILAHAKNISTSDDALQISASDFNVTGEDNVLYGRAYISEPEPELDAELFSDGETEGWMSFLVRESEGNLILVLDEMWSFDEDENRYLALDEGASVTVDPALFDIGATSVGLSRQDPAPIGETVTTDEFEITLTDVMRGDEVYNMLLEVNQFNDPPGEGMTYLSALIHARRIGTADRAVEIYDFNFDSTGNSNILYELPSVVEPDDGLDAYLFPGGETEGLVIVEVPEDETDLMLVFEPLFEFDDENLRFLAIDDGASVEVPEELQSITSNDIGEEKSNPAVIGETVVTENFEFTVTEVIRGNEALSLAQEANQFNDPPDEGMEYVGVKIKVRRIDPNDDWISIDGGSFEVTGDNGVVYDLPFVVEPDPRFDIRLFPGGEYEGWAFYQAAEGESGLILVYDTLFGIGERYFALE